MCACLCTRAHSHIRYADKGTCLHIMGTSIHVYMCVSLYTQALTRALFFARMHEHQHARVVHPPIHIIIRVQIPAQHVHTSTPLYMLILLFSPSTIYAHVRSRSPTWSHAPGAYTYTCIRMCMHTCIYTHTHVYACVCIHVYTH